MSRARIRTFDELDVLTTCALRIDGYTWAVNSGLERHQLLRAFWHEEAWDELFVESWTTSGPPGSCSSGAWRGAAHDRQDSSLRGGGSCS